MKRLAWAVLVLLAASPVLADAGALTFSQPVLTDPITASGEPGIKVSDLGIIYINSLSVLSDTVAMSVDGGATFVPIHQADYVFGGGDDALALDHTGGVYLAGQWHTGVGCQSISTSKTGGVGWYTALAPCDASGSLTSPLGASSDRPWLAVYQPTPLATPVVLMMHHMPCCGGNHYIVRSLDGGVTYSVAGRITTRGGFPGNLVVDEPRGLVYAFYSVWSGGWVEQPGMAVSTDLGSTWTEHLLPSAGTGTGLRRVTGAVDRDGNVYVTWAARGSGQFDVYIAHSTDRGASWSAPQRVTTATGTHIYPWVVAGAAGRVDLVWYETNYAGDPNSMTGAAYWNVTFAQSLDALSGAPTWTSAAVTTVGMHRGILCTNGAACGGQGLNRNLLDFFEMALDPQGMANIVFAADYRPATLPGTGVSAGGRSDSFVKQTGGPSLYG
jgi:hypothetical protein